MGRFHMLGDILHYFFLQGGADSKILIIQFGSLSYPYSWDVYIEAGFEPIIIRGGITAPNVKVWNKLFSALTFHLLNGFQALLRVFPYCPT